MSSMQTEFLDLRNSRISCRLAAIYCQLAVSCVRVSTDGEAGVMKPVKRCTVQLDNQLRIIYNWVAPEVLSGQPFSSLSDIYSLCAVLWEAAKGMLTPC